MRLATTGSCFLLNTDVSIRFRIKMSSMLRWINHSPTFGLFFFFFFYLSVQKGKNLLLLFGTKMVGAGVQISGHLSTHIPLFQRSPFPLWGWATHRVWPSGSKTGPTVPVSFGQKPHLNSILRVAGYKYIRRERRGEKPMMGSADVSWWYQRPGGAPRGPFSAAAVREAANEHPIFRLELIFTR